MFEEQIIAPYGFSEAREEKLSYQGNFSSQRFTEPKGESVLSKPFLWQTLFYYLLKDNC